MPQALRWQRSADPYVMRILDTQVQRASHAVKMQQELQILAPRLTFALRAQLLRSRVARARTAT